MRFSSAHSPSHRQHLVERLLELGGRLGQSGGFDHGCVADWDQTVSVEAGHGVRENGFFMPAIVRLLAGRPPGPKGPMRGPSRTLRPPSRRDTGPSPPAIGAGH